MLDLCEAQVISQFGDNERMQGNETFGCRGKSGDGLSARMDTGENLDEVFVNCMPRLLRAADCILHNHHDSEDALQDSWLSALRHLDQFQGNAKFSTWLYSIVRNAALARLRSQQARTIVSISEAVSGDEPELNALEFLAAPGPDPERECARSELKSQFARVFEHLPPQYRAIIWLCDFEGLSGREAARQLGLTVSALKAQHHRARLAIRERMETCGTGFSA
jgi:RNA polymerase sigma-70 factor, ECF subfamily